MKLVRMESNANFSVTLSKQGTHYHPLYCQHLNKSSSSALRPALSNLWLLLVIYFFKIFFSAMAQIGRTHIFFFGYGTDRPHSYLKFFSAIALIGHTHIFFLFSFFLFTLENKKRKFIKTKLKYIYKK